MSASSLFMMVRSVNFPSLHHHHHQFLNREGRWGTTDDFTTSFPIFSVFHCSLGLGKLQACLFLDVVFPLFFCLPCFLHPFTMRHTMVLARPDERETCPYHCSLCLFKVFRMSSCGSIASWILARTSSLVTWSLYEMCGILR